MAKSVNLGPLSVLLVSLVMISESDTGSSTAQLCEGGEGERGRDEGREGGREGEKELEKGENGGGSIKDVWSGE